MGMIIDCKKLSQQHRDCLANQMRSINGKPGLAVILVGDNPASNSYVRNKRKACDELGIYSEVCHLPSNITTESIVNMVRRYSERNDIHGILVQLPLPAHVDVYKVISAIPPEKDVDAITPINMGNLLLGNYGFVPCTPKGIMSILKYACGSVSGANCVVVGRSKIVGKPLAALLTQEDATVTLCHSKTENLSCIAEQADILISSVGKPGFITSNMVKQGAIVIDVGINRTGSGKIVGDVSLEEVLKKANMVTPVPGGVGVMTVTSLLENTCDAYLHQQGEVRLGEY